MRDAVKPTVAFFAFCFVYAMFFGALSVPVPGVLSFSPALSVLLAVCTVEALGHKLYGGDRRVRLFRVSIVFLYGAGLVGFMALVEMFAPPMPGVLGRSAAIGAFMGIVFIYVLPYYGSVWVKKKSGLQDTTDANDPA